MEKDKGEKVKAVPIEFEDEDFYEKKEERREPGIQMLCFRLGKEFYATPIQSVLEVIKISRLTFLPSSPFYNAGICNLRGNIISVADLKKFFGLEEEERSDRGRIIVVSKGNNITGLLVDEVFFVAEIRQSQIDPPLTTISKEKARYFKGDFRHNGRLFVILDTDVFLAHTSKIRENKP